MPQKVITYSLLEATMGIHKFGGEIKYPCPICSKENYAHETFRCRRCGKQYLCVEHLDNREKVCENCVTAKPKDKEEAEGMVMVHGGEFIMGSDEGDLNAKPAHKIKLDAFMIDKNPVSNAQYQKFNPDHKFPPEKENEPVVNISWHEARDYAVWAGKRLPTEEQWEKAARGTDGRTYPWGKDEPDRWLKGGAEEPIKALKRFNISPYGVKDMVGGFFEWTASTFEPYPEGDPSDPAYFQGAKVLRGGELGLKPAHAYDRAYTQPNEARGDITFRCIKDIPKETTLIQFIGFDVKSREEKDELEAKRAKIESRHQTKATSPTEYRGKPKPYAVESAPRIDEPVREKVSPKTPSPVAQKPTTHEPAPSAPRIAVWIIAAIVIIAIAIMLFLVFMRASAKGLNARESIYFIEHDQGKTFIAQTNPGVPTITRISTSGSESDPIVSKNGRMIGFISQRDGRPDIFVMKPNGNDWLNLTKGGGEKERPAITPDGKKIYFAMKSGNWDIYMCNTDGSGLAPVVQASYNDHQPTISCDGKYLCFVSERGADNVIVVTNPDGKQERIVAKGESLKSYPVFTPDPTVVAYRCNENGNYEIHYADIMKGEAFRGSETYINEGRFDFNCAGDYIIMCWDNPLDQEPCGLFSMRCDGTGRAELASDANKMLEMPCAHLAGMGGYWAAKYHHKYTKQKDKGSQPIKKSVAMSIPKKIGPTGITVKKGNLVSFKVQNWDLAAYYKEQDQWVKNGEKLNVLPNPPLVVEIGESPQLYIGAMNSFRSDWDGEIKLIHTGDKVIPPEKSDKFIVEIEVK